MVFGLRLGLPKKAPAEPPRNEPSPAKSGGAGGVGAGKSALTVNEFVARTKRCREKGLEPTKPELIAYARYLGIDPIADADLMWIADEALNAPLPSEWTEHHDSADRVFYYNVQTHASSWTHPLEQLHRDTYKSIVSFRSGDLSKEDQAVELEKLRRKCEDSERDAHKELQAWTEHVDEQGQKFYYNRDQQRSVWTDPRPARCHSLYLQMKALRVLSKHCGQSATSTTGLGRGPERLEFGGGGGGGGPLSDRHRGSDDILRKSQIPLSLGNSAEGASAMAGDKDDRKDKKRKKRKDRDDGGLASLDDRDDDLLPDAGGGHIAPLDAINSRLGALDFKKPSTAAVDEVRAALGVAGQRMRGPLADPLARLPTPPGDGLATVGRTRVRAGIRLEPLKPI